MPGHAPAHRVRRDAAEDRRAEDGADVVGARRRQRAAAAPSQSVSAKPKRAIASPQSAAATRDARAPAGARARSSPRRATRRARRRTGAAYSRPTTPAPPSKWFGAIAGKSACGIPKTIAFESTRNMPSSTFLRPTKRKPSAIVRRLGRSASCGGRQRGQRQTDHERGRERGRVEQRTSPSRPSDRDQHAAERRPGDVGRAASRSLSSAMRGGELAPRSTSRGISAFIAGDAEREERRRERAEHVQRPDPRLGRATR